MGDGRVEHGANAVSDWLQGAEGRKETRRIELTISTHTADGLTLRQLQLLGAADAILYEPGTSLAVLDRARADAPRFAMPHSGPLPAGLVLVLRRS